MASGVIWGSFTGVSTDRVRPYIEWSSTPNSSTNQSSITATLVFVKYNATYYSNNQSMSNTSNIDGSTSPSNNKFNIGPKGTAPIYSTVRSRTVTVTHNADGTRTCWIGWSGQTGTSLGNFDFGATVTLDTITRAGAVNTTSASSVGGTSATVGGNVTDAGIPAVTRGIHWGTSSGNLPNWIESGSGWGSYSVNITGLSRGTTYYFRAGVYNSSGWAYGSTLSFTTTAAAPSVTTASVSGISYDRATLGGEVTNDNGATVTERGVCYSATNSQPTTADTKDTNGSGTGSFSEVISGLSPDTTYYFRAYAINSQGTSYGAVYSFTTESSIPTVTTTSGATGVTISSATVVGNVLSDNGSTITERGFVYSMTETNPTTSHSKATVSGTTGTMSREITGLSIGTKYYYRAYATNARGTGYGAVYSFTTLPGNPSNLVATTLDKDKVSLTWVKGNGGNYTIIRRGTTPPANINSGTLIYQGTGTSMTDTGLSHGTTYYYRAWSATTADWSEAYSSSYTASSAITTYDFVNPTNVYVDDTNYATVPTNDAKLYAQVSRDGGNTWSATKELTIASLATQSFGSGQTEIWGMSGWNGGHMNDTNFRVKLIGGSNGTSYQIYKSFGFNINSSYILTGIEVQIKAAWDNSNILVYFLKVNAYYGESPLPVKAGSLAYDSTTNRIVYYDGAEWKQVANTEDIV